MIRWCIAVYTVSCINDTPLSYFAVVALGLRYLLASPPPPFFIIFASATQPSGHAADVGGVGVTRSDSESDKRVGWLSREEFDDNLRDSADERAHIYLRSPGRPAGRGRRPTCRPELSKIMAATRGRSGGGSGGAGGGSAGGQHRFRAPKRSDRAGLAQGCGVGRRGRHEPERRGRRRSSGQRRSDGFRSARPRHCFARRLRRSPPSSSQRIGHVLDNLHLGVWAVPYGGKKRSSLQTSGGWKMF